MMIGQPEYQKAEVELRRLLDGGSSLGDALRVMQKEHRIGLILLWPAVASIQQVTKEEAMRIVVHETAP